MKLYYSLTSPFARKVRILAFERGLTDRIRGVPTDPWSEESLRALNPLCQVPTLELDDGSTLFDSPLICEYLDQLAGAKLVPPAGPERWRALRLQALADGLCEAAIRRRLEAIRPESQRAAASIERQRKAAQATLDAAEREPPAADALTVGEISLACALGYLDLRFPAENWRAGHPRLAAWYKAFSQRPSMLATEPPRG